ncbi:MAG: hypothetical protein JWO42_817 [Chloroflexi bacterium]|nr:hypothetical protein [Chloroflexota bacterium]
MIGMSVQLAEGTIAMGSSKKLVDRLGINLARVLAMRAATPVILSGTLAVAAFGAAALNPASLHQASHAAVRTPLLVLDAPRTFCEPDPDGDGHTICHVTASQVSIVPNLGCFADPDGDGTFVCYYATDPTVAH